MELTAVLVTVSRAVQPDRFLVAEAIFSFAQANESFDYVTKIS
jgi:hypothetical protein